MELNENKALKEVENALRGFLAETLQKTKGTNWITNCGVSKDRIVQWKERREIEKKKQKFGSAEERLIFYSDFYDLITIIDKNWNEELKQAIGEKSEVKNFLKILDNFRNSDAHRRDLLPHQKHIIIGLSGEIRNRIIRYRSKMETGKDIFPRIESIRDSLGNVGLSDHLMVHTNCTLRLGDKISFIISAVDPLGDQLEYSILKKNTANYTWTDNPEIEITIDENHIGLNTEFTILIRSKRKYHASGNWDDFMGFIYSVLPPKENL